MVLVEMSLTLTINKLRKCYVHIASAICRKHLKGQNHSLTNVFCGYFHFLLKVETVSIISSFPENLKELGLSRMQFRKQEHIPCLPQKCPGPNYLNHQGAQQLESGVFKAPRLNPRILKRGWKCLKWNWMAEPNPCPNFNSLTVIFFLMWQKGARREEVSEIEQ